MFLHFQDLQLGGVGGGVLVVGGWFTVEMAICFISTAEILGAMKL